MKDNERYLIRAFDTLETRLSESDLQTLCFRMGIDYDDLPEKGRINKLRNLLIYLERRNRISDLVNEGEKSRPDIPWAVLFQRVNERLTEIECLPVYPYEHFTDSFRDVIAPLSFKATGSVLNIVFGDISKVEQTSLAVPINQGFDFWQRGRGSVLGSLEEIIVNNQLFFDSLKQVWPLNERPKNAGIGHSHFVQLPQNSRMLKGVIFTVTTRNLSNSPVHYGRYVNTPLEGIDYILDNVLNCVRGNKIESLALPLLGTGYANISRTFAFPYLGLLIRKIVIALSIRKVEECLTDHESMLRRGIIVLYSSRPNSEEEHQIWEFVVRFIQADPHSRLLQIEKLTEELKEYEV